MDLFLGVVIQTSGPVFDERFFIRHEWKFSLFVTLVKGIPNYAFVCKSALSKVLRFATVRYERDGSDWDYGGEWFV